MSASVAKDKETKRIYVGNLGANVTRDDLEQLFGLSATCYLKENCFVEIAKCEKTGKSKNFAFINVPQHVHTELMKLNGIEFYGRQLVIEEAKTKPEDEDKENKDITKKTTMKKRPMGRGQSRGGKWFPNQRQKYNVPTIDPEQVYHLVDGGVNLTNKKFSENLDFVIARALKSGVQKMVVTGLKRHACRSAVVMSKTRPNILYAAVGIHPHFVKDDWKEKTVDDLEDLLKNPEVVAVGECGLDFCKEYSPRELQETAFKKQVQLAVRYQKALLVHDRDAHQSILDIFKEFDTSLPPVIIHCFTGTSEQIKAYVERGYYIGVTGYLCKEKYGKGIRDAIKDGTLPLNRIIVQTNAPYMTPSVPRNEIDEVSQTLLNCCGVENEPCTLSIIVKEIAKCLSQEPRDVADACTETAMKVFRFQKFEPNNYE